MGLITIKQEDKEKIKRFFNKFKKKQSAGQSPKQPPVQQSTKRKLSVMEFLFGKGLGSEILYYRIGISSIFIISGTTLIVWSLFFI